MNFIRVGKLGYFIYYRNVKLLVGFYLGLGDFIKSCIFFYVYIIYLVRRRFFIIEMGVNVGGRWGLRSFMVII